MSLNNHTKKTTREVFDRFSDVDEGFIKTQIPIAHIFPYGNPVSRSEGRRLGELISKFKEVSLDFIGVEDVGQAFCHEIFVVWQNRHTDVTLNICNANKDVDWMIRRVKNTKYDRFMELLAEICKIKNSGKQNPEFLFLLFCNMQKSCIFLSTVLFLKQLLAIILRNLLRGFHE